MGYLKWYKTFDREQLFTNQASSDIVTGSIRSSSRLLIKCWARVLAARRCLVTSSWADRDSLDRIYINTDQTLATVSYWTSGSWKIVTLVWFNRYLSAKQPCRPRSVCLSISQWQCWKCLQDDAMTGWCYDRMTLWQDAVMTGWWDDGMTGWQDDQMTRWPDD